MKVFGSTTGFQRPLNPFARPSANPLGQSLAPRQALSTPRASSVWTAIQRIQTILLERQDKAALGSATGQSSLYAENKSIVGNDVSGATLDGKFLDVKAVTMSYVDSNASDTRFTSKSVLNSSFDGDRTTVVAERVANSVVTGGRSTITTKSFSGGQIKGDDVTLNAETIEGLLQVSGNGAKINAAKIDFATVSGDGASVKTGTLGAVTITADNITIAAETARSIALRGGANTIAVGSATDVRGGNGNDRLAVDKAAFVSGGKGNDTLTLGAGVREVRFNAGDGRDTIIAADGARIAFGAGLRRDDLVISRDGDHYRLSFRNSADEINLQMDFDATSTLSFADGSKLTLRA